jgi:uncharacterized protein YgiM (DUF1202 family)
MRHTLSVLPIAVVMVFIGVACTPVTPASIVEIEQTPTPPPTRVIIYVTPTPQPTIVPTFNLVTSTPTPTQTPIPTLTPDPAVQEASCRARLEALYTSASELCLGKPDGFFCNGGMPPRVQPEGPVSSALAVPGALVEADAVESLQTVTLPSGDSGGLMWLRLYENVDVKGVLIGEVAVRNVTLTDMDFPEWQSIVVETTSHESLCSTAPRSTFVVQSEYGASAAMVINGVSVTLRGTLAIQTQEQTTSFITLEGSSRLTVLGVERLMYAGQQVDVTYGQQGYERPAGIPPEARPLTRTAIEHLPVVLFDRPLLLPQPGYVFTEGRVNMRAEPGLDGELLYQVPPDEILSVLGQNEAGTWYHIRLGNGETGWMSAELLRGEVGDIEAVYRATPQPPQRYGDLGTRAVVSAQQGGNLRESPDVSFPVITTLEQGTEVELQARSPYSPWVKVRRGNTVGWMALITIDTRAVVGSLPVDYEVQPPPRPTSTPVYSFGGGHAYPDPNGGS